MQLFYSLQVVLHARPHQWVSVLSPDWTGCEAKPTVLMCCIVNLQADMRYQIWKQLSYHTS